jgi:hypothetical protein
MTLIPARSIPTTSPTVSFRLENPVPAVEISETVINA